jgi:hypothetical protein
MGGGGARGGSDADTVQAWLRAKFACSHCER